MQALGIDSVHFKPRAEVFPGTDIAVAVHTDHGNELASMHSQADGRTIRLTVAVLPAGQRLNRR